MVYGPRAFGERDASLAARGPVVLFNSHRHGATTLNIHAGDSALRGARQFVKDSFRFKIIYLPTIRLTLGCDLGRLDGLTAARSQQ